MCNIVFLPIVFLFIDLCLHSNFNILFLKYILKSFCFLFIALIPLINHLETLLRGTGEAVRCDADDCKRLCITISP